MSAEATRRRGGFTLLELVVALAVFSVAALALLQLSGAQFRAVDDAERRALAAVVAENVAVEASLTRFDDLIPLATGEALQAGRLWRWEVRLVPAGDPDLVRLDIAVREAGDEQVAAALSLHRSR